jgi:hypothetical protein
MAPRWLYEIDGRGLFVTLEFMDRLRGGDASTLRALQKVDLTTLYRRKYSRRKRWETPGFFWAEDEPLVRIPIARGGRHSPGAWVRDYLTLSDRTADERRIKQHIRDIAAERRSLKQARAGRKRKPPSTAEGLLLFRGEQALIEQWEKLNGPLPQSQDEDVFYTVTRTHDTPAILNLKAYRMKPNPKFELVVVNKHDRAALLKLLSEIDTSPTVESWLSERTERGGATLSSALFIDYEGWCSASGEVALGRKAFAQALVANGIVKLTRSRGGERYEVELRPAPRSAGTSAR